MNAFPNNKRPGNQPKSPNRNLDPFKKTTVKLNQKQKKKLDNLLNTKRSK